MLEVEMKFANADHEKLEEQLIAWGAKVTNAVEEADQYFKAPDRDFAKTDEALRIRRVGNENFVTYKGPKRDLETKTRPEIEVPLGDGDAAAADFGQLLMHLGYRPAGSVHKRRRKFKLSRNGFAIEAVLDEVDGLGKFAELEILAPEETLDRARAVLLQTAGELGLATSERRSYLQLLLAKEKTP